MPAENARGRNSRIGTIGARVRNSQPMKATVSSNPAARAVSTSALIHLATLPRSRPHTKANAAAATITSPGISSAANGPKLSRSRAGARPDFGLSQHQRQRWRTRAPPAPTARLRRGIPAEAIGQKPKPRSGGPDVAVTQIRGLFRGELVLALQGGQPVLGEGWHPDIIGGLEIDPVHAGRVAAEDQLLDRAVGATEWSKSIFLLHILRDFEPTQRLDLPLRRPVPTRVGAPYAMLDPLPLAHRP